MLFKKSRFTLYKKLSTQMPITASLDIHDDSTYVYCVDLVTGDLLIDINVKGHYKKVLRHLKKLGSRQKVLVLYEAGPHAFAPYRLFTKHGFSTKVIAPVSIPRRNREQKTDREEIRSSIIQSGSQPLLLRTRSVLIPRVCLVPSI